MSRTVGVYGWVKTRFRLDPPMRGTAGVLGCLPGTDASTAHDNPAPDPQTLAQAALGAFSASGASRMAWRRRNNRSGLRERSTLNTCRWQPSGTPTWLAAAARTTPSVFQPVRLSPASPSTLSWVSLVRTMAVSDRVVADRDQDGFSEPASMAVAPPMAYFSRVDAFFFRPFSQADHPLALALRTTAKTAAVAPKIPKHRFMGCSMRCVSPIIKVQDGKTPGGLGLWGSMGMGLVAQRPFGRADRRLSPAFRSCGFSGRRTSRLEWSEDSL